MIYNKLFLLSGTSGVGKTTVAYKLLEQLPNLKRLVTYVTREPRPGETNGIDYHFVSREEFEKRLAAGEFFEHDEHYGNWYGNSRKDLEKIWADDHLALAVLDPNGVRSIKKIFPEAKTIFIEPDNLDNLKNRIRQRPMTDEAFEKRWVKVLEELKEATSYDFRIVNAEGKLDEAVEQVKNIIETPPEQKIQLK